MHLHGTQILPLPEANVINHLVSEVSGHVQSSSKTQPLGVIQHSNQGKTYLELVEPTVH